MPKARLLLTLLLILVIPVQGMTAVVLLKQPCPMDQQMMKQQAMEHDSKAPCCQDGDNHMANDASCKPGQECHISQMSVNGDSIPLAANPPGAPVFLPATTDLPPLLLSAIWRPPLSLLQ